MREKKVIEVSVWKRLQSHFQGFRDPANRDQSRYPQMEETWNSGEASQQWELLQELNNGS